MKRPRPCFLLFLLFCSVPTLCQDKPADPYKATLDRLDSLTRQGETEWRFFAGIPPPPKPPIQQSGLWTWAGKKSFRPGGAERSGRKLTGTRGVRRPVQNT